MHAVDVEGKRCGIQVPYNVCTYIDLLVVAAITYPMCSLGALQQELVELLAEWSPIPVTYAGGASSLVRNADLL